MSSAGIISRILGFFYKIFLSRTIGATGLGLYQLIFPIFTLCLSICTSGIQTAISRFVAIEISGNSENKISNSNHTTTKHNKYSQVDSTIYHETFPITPNNVYNTQLLHEKNARRYLYSGLLISLSLCMIFTMCVYIFAPWISNTILKEPKTEALLRIMSFTFIPAAIHSCFNGYFYGKKISIIPSVCQILEQVARVGGTVLIYTILSNQNMPLLAIHAVWGLVISECMGLVVCLTGFLWQNTDSNSEKNKNTVNSSFKKTDLLSTVKPLLTMAIPLSMNHILMSLSHSLENMLIPQQLMAFGFTSEEALGHFGILSGMALSIIFFPAVITNSLSVLLLPRISELKVNNDKTSVIDTIKGAAACGIVFGCLCTFFFLFSANWIGSHIFENQIAGFYVQILSILCPFMYTSSLLSSIVNGLGYSHLTLLCNISGCLLRIAAIWFFIPTYGMYAYIFSLIAAALLTTIELACVVAYVVRSHI